jgi:hypothetical protein
MNSIQTSERDPFLSAANTLIRRDTCTDAHLTDSGLSVVHSSVDLSRVLWTVAFVRISFDQRGEAAL